MSLPWNLIPGWVLAIATAVGNGLLIFLITTRRNLKTTTNWFVLSLAVADFGVGAVYYQRRSVCPNVEPPQRCANEAANIAFSSIGLWCVYASGANLCMLTLDRYLAIVHPLRYVTFMTKKRVAVLILAAWGVALLISLPLFLSFVLSGMAQKVVFKIFSLCNTVLCVSSCMFLLFATGRIILTVHRIAKRNSVLVAQLNFNHQLEHGAAFKAREGATAKLFGIVVTVYVVTCSLHVAYFVLDMAGARSPKIMFEIATIVLLLNSALNPVVYAFYKKEFNKELKRLFRCNRQQVLQNNSRARGEVRGSDESRPRFRNRVEQASTIEL